MHHQVSIAHGDWQAEVDEGLAELLLEIWKKGIWTTFSCQDRDGRAWIQLPASSLSHLCQALRSSSDLLTVEYRGPASLSNVREHNVFFSLTDAGVLARALAENR